MNCWVFANYTVFCRLILPHTLIKNLIFSVIYDLLCCWEKYISKVWMDITYKTLCDQVRTMTIPSPAWLEHGSIGVDLLDCFFICLVWFVDNLVVAICWMRTGSGADPDWWGFGLLKPSPSKPQVAMRFAGNTVHHWIWLVQPISSDTSHST